MLSVDGQVPAKNGQRISGEEAVPVRVEFRLWRRSAALVPHECNPTRLRVEE